MRSMREVLCLGELQGVTRILYLLIQVVLVSRKVMSLFHAGGSRGQDC